MKIDRFKILEKNSEIDKSIKTMIIEHEKCKEFITLFKDVVIEKYIELSKDDSYQPEIGPHPYKVKRNKLSVTDASIWKNGVNFKVEAYGYEYYIFMSPEEIEHHIVKNTASKYNL
jgi:hypothetical protein